MATFSLPDKYDAAFCTVDSFRHLLTEQQALSHLMSIGKALKKGGLYILGLHIINDDCNGVLTICWTHRRGGLTVTTTMKMLKLDLNKRIETLQVTLRPKTSTHILPAHTSIYDLRTYNLSQLIKLIKKSNFFRIEKAFDEYYDLKRPIELNEKTDYVVLILKRI